MDTITGSIAIGATALCFAGHLNAQCKLPLCHHWSYSWSKGDASCFWFFLATENGFDGEGEVHYA